MDWKQHSEIESRHGETWEPVHAPALLPVHRDSPDWEMPQYRWLHHSDQQNLLKTLSLKVSVHVSLFTEGKKNTKDEDTMPSHRPCRVITVQFRHTMSQIREFLPHFTLDLNLWNTVPDLCNSFSINALLTKLGNKRNECWAISRNKNLEEKYDYWFDDIAIINN